MADYTDIGFNQFLQKQDPYPGNGGAIQMDPLQSDYQMQSMSGSKINGGVLASADGKFIIDLNNGIFKINNGSADLITMGQLSDGNIGFQVQDGNGNTIMEVSNNSIFIQSSNKHISLDFVLEKLIVTDDNGIPNVLIGALS